MQFRDLGAQYAAMKEEMDTALAQVIASSRFIGGSQVEELEEKLAAYVGVKHCITCANGTDALTLAMMAWEIGPGDAVFVPDFTFFSSGEIVAFAGAVPVFVDVEEDTFNLSPESLERAVQRVCAEGRLRPRAIVAVDLFGQPADYERIREIADRYGLWILEDGAQGFGGNIGGRRACSFGDISTTSFFPAKPLGCYGDGGAVFTDNDAWASLLRSLHVHGKGTFKYDNVRIGMNSRLDTLQAAVLLTKLPLFEARELADVNRVADRYDVLLREAVITPTVRQGFFSSWAQYTIRLRDETQRDGVQAFLRSMGIPTMIYYPKAMHRQQAFAQASFDDADFPCTLRLCETVLSLPLHPYMSEEDTQTVADAILSYLRENS